MDEQAELLAFWFAPGCETRWFATDPAFDAEIRDRFEALAASAAAGALDGWARSAEGALALMLLLDQVPRNLHRGRDEAFASDAKARSIARAGIAEGLDRALPPIRRQFLYLPFEHSEDLRDQEELVRLFASLPEGELRTFCLDYARRHHKVVARFGRFPHRNAVLGRVCTAEEEAFLASPEAPY